MQVVAVNNNFSETSFASLIRSYIICAGLHLWWRRICTAAIP